MKSTRLAIQPNVNPQGLRMSISTPADKKAQKKNQKGQLNAVIFFGSIDAA